MENIDPFHPDAEGLFSTTYRSLEITQPFYHNIQLDLHLERKSNLIFLPDMLQHLRQTLSKYASTWPMQSY